LKAREWFAEKLKALPVEHHLDAAGNRWVTLAGASERALVVGSHLDSVPNGGWLDGCLGVIAGLEVLTEFAERYEGRPPVTVKLVDWADEEGARFGRSLFGSAAFSGKHTIAADRGRTDKDGVTLEAALSACAVDVDRVGDAAVERKNLAAYLTSRWEWCWAPRAWSAGRSRFTVRRRTPVPLLWKRDAMPWPQQPNWRWRYGPLRRNIRRLLRRWAA
jgi:N-carbamoyl-L-amino-acid hydrolase